MIPARWRRIIIPLVLSLVLLVSACSKAEEPSRFAKTQQETSQRNAPAAVAKGTEQGSAFNKFFPGSSGGYEVVPAQEKRGFAEYKVNQNGKNVAMLSINDTVGNPAAVTKFQDTDLKVAGFPAVEQGSNITAILVNNRYQVKVQSRDPAFTKEDRAAWIQKFDLRGLARMPSATSLRPKMQPAPVLPGLKGNLQPAANPT
jgi:hypothetical protein